MKIATKLMLAAVCASTLSFVSCKDYEEDDRNDIVVNVSQINATTKAQIDALTQQVKDLAVEVASKSKCGCQIEKVPGTNNYKFTKIVGNDTTVLVVQSAQTGFEVTVDDKGDSCLIVSLYDEKGNKLPGVNDLTYYQIDRELLDSIHKNLNDVQGYTYIDQDSKEVYVPGLNDYVKGYTDGDGKYQPGLNDIVLNGYTYVATIPNPNYDPSDPDSPKTIQVNVQSDGVKAINEAIRQLIYGINPDGTVGTEENPVPGSLLYRLNDLEAAVAALQEDMLDMQDARAKLVTGIIVQEVYNPAIGSYASLLSNMQTSFLMGYYGQASNAIDFYGYTAAAGETLVADSSATGNMGMLYLTINPVDQDFDKLVGLKLVNSQDAESSVVLDSARTTDKVLTFGLSRAANNGFYQVAANIKPEDIKNDGKLHINIDKGAVKTALSDLIKTRSAADAKVALKELAGVAVNVIEAQRLERLGVKCAWADSLGEHAVYSNYGVAAIAVKPLGFNALDGLSNVPGYNKLVDLIAKLKDKIDTKVVARINKEIANYKDKINQRGIIKVESQSWYGKEGFAVTLSYVGNADVETTVKEFNQKLIDAGQTPIIISTNASKKQMVVFLEVEDEFNEFLQGITMNDLATFTKMVNDLLNRADGKIEKVEDKVYDKLMEYLDKANDKGTAALHKILKPTLAVKSNEGIGLAAVEGAVPAKVTGKVVILPTTFSAELASPIFKKYIKVGDNAGEIVEGKEIDITDKLVPGVNKIVFSALDYTGQKITATYVVEK